MFLVNSSGEEIVLDSSAAYINMADGRVSFDLPNIPEDDYTELRFLLGVDSTINHQNPNLFAASSPLNPIINNLYWDCG
ncbi:MAG: MbnP family protein [Candidatus Kapaibacterium sp.]